VWYAQLVSLFGDFLALFAVLSVVTYRMHGTPTQVTGVSIAYMLPLAVLGPLSGVFVDRWPVKPTLVASDLIRAALVLLLFAAGSVWQIYLVLGALSCVSSFFAPAQSVTIRTYVPPHGLISANGLMQMAMLGARIVGPAAAGAIVALFGPPVCYALDFVSFVGSAALIGTVGIVRPLPPKTETANSKLHQILHDMREGAAYIFHHAALSFVVLAMAAGMFVIGCFGPLIAIWVREVLHGTALEFGVVSAMVGVGMICGMPVVRRLSGTVSNAALVLSGLAGIGLGAFLLGALPWPAASAFACFALGFTFSGVVVPAQTLMQRETPPSLMGRIGATSMSVIFLGQLFGLLLSGVLAEHIGVRAVFFLCAVLALVLTGAGKWLLGTERHAAAL
jgi:MFS family permease